MNTPHDRGTEHLSDDDVAAFIDGATSALEASRIRAHLKACETCFRTYHDAVRIGASHSAGRQRVWPGEGAVRAALDIASTDRRAAARPATRRDRRWFPVVGRGGVVLAASLAAVLMTLFLWRQRSTVDTRLDPLGEGMGPVTRAMIDASSQRPIVLPGVEDRIVEPTSSKRAGPVKATAAFDEAMGALVDGYRNGSLPQEGVNWIIGGYLATGQYRNARTFVDIARPSLGANADFMVLESLLAYTENNLSECERLLRRVIERDPDHWVARLDLAVVLSQTGRADESLHHLERVRDGSPVPALVARATRLIADQSAAGAGE